MGRTKNVIASSCLAFLTIVGILAIIGSGGGGDGGSGSSGGGGNTCAGPVPCLTVNWVNNREFREPNGNPLLAFSDGQIFAGAGFNSRGDIVALAGNVINCYNGRLTTGGIDFSPPDGRIDYWYRSVNGNLNICKRILRVTNLVLDNIPQQNIVATYVRVVKSPKINDGQTSGEVDPEILHEILDNVRREK